MRRTMRCCRQPFPVFLLTSLLFVSPVWAGIRGGKQSESEQTDREIWRRELTDSSFHTPRSPVVDIELIEDDSDSEPVALDTKHYFKHEAFAEMAAEEQTTQTPSQSDPEVSSAPGDILKVGSTTIIVMGPEAQEDTSGSNPMPFASNGPLSATSDPLRTRTRTPSFVEPNALLNLLQSVSPFDGSELLDSTSYQNSAYQWLQAFEYRPELKSSSIQRYALACIRFATNAIPNKVTRVLYADDSVKDWKTFDYWLTGTPECQWFGIQCQQERVTGIELDGNGLTGTFPLEVILLNETLELLDLSDNHLYNGPEDTDFLASLTNLKKLYLGHSHFEYDGLPPGLGRLSKLEELDCEYTGFRGALDGQVFANMPKLTLLYLGGNSYRSRIPTEIVHLPSLEVLNMERTGLEGDLDFLPHMQKLEVAILDENPGLKGPIPEKIGRLHNLELLSLSSCGLNGTLPTQIGMLKDLVSLRVNDNTIRGEIPTHIGRLKQLESMEVQMNEIVGFMPGEVCALNLDFLTADCHDEVMCSCCDMCYHSGVMMTNELNV